MKGGDPIIEKARMRKAKAALRKLRRIQDEIEQNPDALDLTDWEREFIDSVEDRINEFGSAFYDSEKGGVDESLSYLQKKIVSQLKQKAKGKPRRGFGTRKPLGQKRGFTPNVRIDDVHDEAEDEPVRPPVGKPVLRIVKNDDDT